jgi:sulfur-carrier protein
MLVNVQFFAGARDLAGERSIAIDLPEPAHVGDLRRTLVERLPRLVPLTNSLLFAVGTDYAQDHTPLTPGAQVACFPPVSGG